MKPHSDIDLRLWMATADIVAELECYRDAVVAVMLADLRREVDGKVLLALHNLKSESSETNNQQPATDH